MADNKLIGQQTLSILSLVKDLQEKRQVREAKKLFFIEGVRNFVQVADNGFDIHTILYSKKLCTAALARKLVRNFKRQGIPTASLSPEEFRSISTSHRASGVGAIVRQRWTSLNTILPNADICWVVIEKVYSQGNLGTLVRTSGAIGGAGFIFLGKSMEPFSPDIVRASMGAIFRQKFICTDLRKFGLWLKNNKLIVIGASPDGTKSYHQFTYPQTTFLLLGEERKGLTLDQRAICSDLVNIPMVDQADSLNLGVAGSLLMYEIFLSQRE